MSPELLVRETPLIVWPASVPTEKLENERFPMKQPTFGSGGGVNIGVSAVAAAGHALIVAHAGAVTANTANANNTREEKKIRAADLIIVLCPVLPRLPPLGYESRRFRVACSAPSVEPELKDVRDPEYRTPRLKSRPIYRLSLR